MGRSNLVCRNNIKHKGEKTMTEIEFLDDMYSMGLERSMAIALLLFAYHNNICDIKPISTKEFVKNIMEFAELG